MASVELGAAAGKHAAEGPSTFFLGRWLFARCLGLAFLAAYVSLLDQGLGLVGSQGLAPGVEGLAAHAEAFGAWAWLRAPSVFWLGISDLGLTVAWWCGCGAAALLVANVAPRAALGVCWVLYLSLAALEGPPRPLLFFGWPPDHVTFEAALLGLFLLPRGLHPGLGLNQPPSRLVRWMCYALVFKLVLGSGLAETGAGAGCLVGPHSVAPRPADQAAPDLVGGRLPTICRCRSIAS